MVITKNRFSPAIMLLAFVLGCTSRGKHAQVLDFGAFTVKTPGGWSIVKRQGVDSYVGGLANGTDSLWFDYGLYDVHLTTDSGYWYRLTEDTVNSLRAVFSVPEAWQRGDLSIKIPSVRNGNCFTMSGLKVRDQATVLQIYKSLMFAGSDSSKNPRLKDVSSFERTNADGDSLFMVNCLACHRLNEIVEAPSLQDLLGYRDADWLYRFFTDQNFRAKDGLHQQLKRAFNNRECIMLDKLTKEDAVALFYYIRSQR